MNDTVLPISGQYTPLKTSENHIIFREHKKGLDWFCRNVFTTEENFTKKHTQLFIFFWKLLEIFRAAVIQYIAD